MKGIVDRIGSVPPLIHVWCPKIITGTVTVAAPILLDAGSGFVTGIISYAAISATCIRVGSVIAWRIRSPDVAIVAIDPVAIGRARI